jgi:hypothetical protein
VLGLRGVTAFGTAVSGVTVRDNQFRASKHGGTDLSDFDRSHFSFADNAYLSPRAANQWFRIDGFPRYGLARWTAFAGESGATTAPFVDPATAPDIEGYQVGIGHEPMMSAFLDKARRQWERHWEEQYTAAAVIAYLRQQLGL